MIEADNDTILHRIYINNLSSFGGKLLFEFNVSVNDICKFTQNIYQQSQLIWWKTFV